MINVCHLTTVHKRYDVRIFWKMCLSLAKNGFNVNLIVADGKGNEIKNNVYIWDIGKPRNRIDRVLNFGKKILKKALELDCLIYHLHDPELLYIGLLLKKNKKKVIYDVHEDYSTQLLYKYYLRYLGLNNLFSSFFDFLEKYFSKKFDYIITATDYIRGKFVKNNLNVITIFNYPILEEFNDFIDWENRENFIVYSGLISRYRGFYQILKIANHIDKIINYLGNVKIILMGTFENLKLKKDFDTFKASTNNIEYLGFLNRDELKNVLSKSKIGLGLILPTKQYLYSLPTKIFEYMGFGVIPIFSNFEFWMNFFNNVEGIFFVNPLDMDSIIFNIKEILINQNLIKKYSVNLRKIVFDRYNWNQESKKLLYVYNTII